ncbi:MAG: 2'-deoxycytidine 5'-triphosphate deaminase [Alphaproteobacteria bacterium]|nr:2'-deoxycytidine 5'-triphosphate deaminase [Alphaproteobacteria bacterium]
MTRTPVQGSLPEVGDAPVAEESAFGTGLLPAQDLRAAIGRGEIAADMAITEEQIQPASLDLRLGDAAYRVRSSFLPGRCSIRQRIDAFAMHRLDLGAGAALERGCVYLVPLVERLRLGAKVSAIANPKSSTGRLDVFARLITDYGSEFDRVPQGYRGPLWVELAPRSFSIIVRAGSRLNQIRLKRGSPVPTDRGLRRLHESVGLIEAQENAPDIRKGLIAISVDARGAGPGSVIGYRARKHAGIIDVDRVAAYDAEAFWEPILALDDQAIVLDPDDFYILASREAITVPADHAAEMVAYSTPVGEFRVHYAGFFDPGFGLAEIGGAGTRAVLEVRSHEVPFLIEDGQIVGRLFYERLRARPDKLYGTQIGSSYQRQGLMLSKHFRPRERAAGGLA